MTYKLGLSMMGWLLLPSLVDGAPPITAVAFSAEGKSVVYASQAAVMVQRLPGKKVASLPTKLPQIHDLVFAPHGKHLAVVGGSPGEWGEVELYDWPSCDFIARRRFDGDVVYSAAWSDDGQQLAVATGNTAMIIRPWQADSVSQAVEFVGHSKPVTAVAFLSETRLLVTAAADQSVRVWNCDTGELQRSLGNHTQKVNAVAVRPGEHRLPQIASVGADRTVRFWQPTIGRMMRFARLGSQPLAVEFTPEGRLAIVGCVDGSLVLINPDTAKIIDRRHAINGWAYAVDIQHDGSAVAVGGKSQQFKLLSFDD